MTAADVVDLRQRLVWTQKQLAYTLGVHTMTVSRWERGEMAPGPLACKELARLARRLNRAVKLA